MGVNGLLSYCLRNKQQCCMFVDLVQVAHERQGIEILVDFYSFLFWIHTKFSIYISNRSGNRYLSILGGEYQSLSHYITNVIKNLQSVGIHLTFLIDGAKGSSKEGFKCKFNTWIKSAKRDIKSTKSMLSVFNQEKNIENLSPGDKKWPVLLEVIFISAVKKCDCKVVNYAGEADDKIAKLLLNSNAYGILSNDSDFCIFQGCRFIPETLFDINNDLIRKSCEVVQPLHLQIGLMSAERVGHMLGLSFDELIELSIVSGNDFTREKRLVFKLNIDIQLEDIAAWVRSYKSIENHPQLHQEMERDCELALAVHHSRSFYKLELDEDFDVQDIGASSNEKSLTELVNERITMQTMSRKLFAVHQGIYWHKSLFEDISKFYPGIEILLSKLRSCIYRILLPPEKTVVDDYGWNEYLDTENFHVAAKKWRWLPEFKEIKEENIKRNLETFHRIITQQEPGWKTRDWPRNYFTRYGQRNGFIFYCLRYFLLLNWERNMYITENEFLALICLVFIKKQDENQYQCYPLMPYRIARCVTIYNWLQDIYLHAYEFLGRLLFVTKEFPEAQELFSGSIWVCLYWYFCEETHPARLMRQERIIFEEIRSNMNEIIHEKRHMIKCLVDGVFQFDNDNYRYQLPTGSGRT